MNLEIATLTNGWSLAATEPDILNDPSELTKLDGSFLPAVVPGTVAQSLKLNIDSKPDLDSKDWWYRCEFHVSSAILETHQKHFLKLSGLATIAQIWLNDRLILESDNMFLEHKIDVSNLLRTKNNLVICFRSLNKFLEPKRPRPRWKTRLIENQALRWVRTTLLGRIPAWTPAITPVGPWKEISLSSWQNIATSDLSIQTSVVKDRKLLTLRGSLQILNQASINYSQLNLKLCVGSNKYPLQLSTGGAISQTIEIQDAELWWPHTHGKPNLYECSLEIQNSTTAVKLALGPVGFKKVELNRENDLVEFIINDVSVFCRGACWTVNDFLSLKGTNESLRATLELAKNHGMNMIRIGGTMIYEHDEFYKLCDELGILVWQDFMFANMDYPVQDEIFSKSIQKEAEQVLKNLSKHPSVTVYCGGSEVQQQAAMMGLPKESWSNSFFDQALPALVTQNHAQAIYFSSSPSEGAFPFSTNKGITHYYGVGAYHRPLEDATLAEVKFASECLGISNIPSNMNLAELHAGGLLPTHHPDWKSRVPRDQGSGYDFEDVRDFYLEKLFQINPIELRRNDLSRYYEISKVVSGEVMKAVFAQWRHQKNNCKGGLVWFLKDLWAGAGWGVIDSSNQPKAALWYLKKAWAPQSILIQNRGLNGLDIHVFNDSADKLQADVVLETFSQGRVALNKLTHKIELTKHSQQTLSTDQLIGYFTDINYSYRFGAPKHDVVRVSLIDSVTKTLIAEDYFFPNHLNFSIQPNDQLQAEIKLIDAYHAILKLKSNCFIQNIQIQSPGFESADQFFHLAPKEEKTIQLQSNQTANSIKAEIKALNLNESIIVRAQLGTPS